MTRSIVLAGACRTPIGKMGGALSGIPAADLGALVIEEALHRAGLPKDCVDTVIMGCVLQGAQGQNVARQAAIKAGLPVEIPAQTLNMVCGSGLQSVQLAALMVGSGQADVVVAGGMENMSAAPFALNKARFGYRLNDSTLIDTLVRDALWDAFGNIHMGITAENIAARYGITREEQDAFAARSQNKCQRARAQGAFREEIVPVPMVRKKERLLVSDDEAPRDNVTVESLAPLRPAFKPDGTVTAGNASGINDGAAAVVVMSAGAAARFCTSPMAYWVAGSAAGVDPAYMGTGPIAATRRLLQQTGKSMQDFDLIEANEAFAAQCLAVGKALDWDDAIVNVNGGAIALGHPVGASGCRILVTLLHAMRQQNARLGLATLCVGGGMGVAAMVENAG